MNYFTFDYSKLNSAGLTPNFCSTFGIGAVCLPSACNLVNGGFTFSDLNTEVSTLLKQYDGSASTEARQAFEFCQTSELLSGCASLNSKFQVRSYDSRVGVVTNPTITSPPPPPELHGSISKLYRPTLPSLIRSRVNRPQNAGPPPVPI